MAIIRALDVGHFSTKFVRTISAKGEAVVRSIPSLALPFSRPDRSEPSDYSTAVLAGDGEQYEVGPLISLPKYGSFNQPMHQGSINSPGYLALARGALRFMDVDAVDLLIVAMPIAAFKRSRQLIDELLTGEHLFPDGRSITVKRTIPVIAPIGAMADFVLSSSRRIQRSKSLVIDVGAFHFGWVLMDEANFVDHRSGCFSAGLASIYRRIAERISRKHKVDFDDLDAIDQGWRGGEVDLDGRQVSVTDATDEGKRFVTESISAMLEVTGDCRDVANIVLVGGGAEFAFPVVQAHFGRRAVMVSRNPVFATVRGCQEIGERWFRDQAGMRKCDSITVSLTIDPLLAPGLYQRLSELPKRRRADYLARMAAHGFAREAGMA